MLSGEAAATNLIVFGFTWPELKHAFYHVRDEHATDSTTDDVAMFWFWWYTMTVANKGNNKITELRTILQRESQNS